MKIYHILAVVIFAQCTPNSAETTTVGPIIRLSADRIINLTPTSGVAEGNVLIEIPPGKRDVTMGIIATGEFATFDLVEGEIVLHGFPQITRRTSTMRAMHSETTVKFDLSGGMRTQGLFRTLTPPRENNIPARDLIERPLQPKLRLPPNTRRNSLSGSLASN